MPGDGLALAVFIACQVQCRGIFEQFSQLGDLRLLACRYHIEWREVLVHIHPQPGPWLIADSSRYLARSRGQIADVADGRLDDESIAQIALDRARLGRRLHDHQSVGSFSCFRHKCVCLLSSIQVCANMCRPYRRMQYEPVPLAETRPGYPLLIRGDYESCEISPLSSFCPITPRGTD